MQYKLIVTDMDGTLLDGNQNISERTKKLITEYTARGGIFTLATGRIEQSVKKYYEELSLKCSAILYNGAKIVDLYRQRVRYETALDLSHALQALRLLKEYPFDVTTYRDGDVYVSKDTEGIMKFAQKDGVDYILVDDLYDFFSKRPPTKILIIDENRDFDDFIARYNNSCRDKPNIVNSEPTYLEILPKGINKGTALEQLSRLLDIDMGETIAIGDNLNDLEMIKRAGLGVAVENAHPLLKAQADRVTSSNEDDGVAEVIKSALQC